MNIIWHMVESFVRNVMKFNVVSINSSSTVSDAAKMMKDASIGCVIITENNTAVGILTERDLVRKIIALQKPLSTSVKDIMSTPLVMIDPDESLWELAEMMKQKQIHKVPVVENGKLVGIVTATDLTRICSLGSGSEMSRICTEIIARMQKI
ncbi:putative signal-transduction protein with CBS domains [Candidatus Nitrosotalea okcheonensis]|uniref:Putative signal-transduction protein with CBS domains n=2 Tax=Candidatus Nitrosotalea okcheonensis TaxID=1903276 RepID=A0A2H1FEA9_9ARCH|nr:putative signal-transduction protein with CBS domains [Candidatus Nitrosotalea okcheonensis]